MNDKIEEALNPCPDYIEVQHYTESLHSDSPKPASVTFGVLDTKRDVGASIVITDKFLSRVEPDVIRSRIIAKLQNAYQVQLNKDMNSCKIGGGHTE